MDFKDIYIKMDNMNEQISKLREVAARTEGILKDTLFDLRARTSDLEDQFETITAQQNRWKGAMIVISALFGALSTVIARVVLK